MVIFPRTTIIPYQDFLHDHILFHLDNPDPVERERVSNPIQIKKCKYPAGLYSEIRILYTTAEMIG